MLPFPSQHLQFAAQHPTAKFRSNLNDQLAGELASNQLDRAAHQEVLDWVGRSPHQEVASQHPTAQAPTILNHTLAGAAHQQVLAWVGSAGARVPARSGS